MICSRPITSCFLFLGVFFTDQENPLTCCKVHFIWDKKKPQQGGDNLNFNSGQGKTDFWLKNLLKIYSFGFLWSPWTTTCRLSIVVDSWMTKTLGGVEGLFFCDLEGLHKFWMQFTFDNHLESELLQFWHCVWQILQWGWARVQGWIALTSKVIWWPNSRLCWYATQIDRPDKLVATSPSFMYL